MHSRMPRGQRLTEWLDAYTDCEACGTLPQEELGDHGQLCLEHQPLWEELELRDRACLVRLALLHVQQGVLLAEGEETPPPPLREVKHGE